MPWENPTLDTDEAGIISRILDGMADRLPGWEPVEGAPEVAIAEEIGREVAATNALAIEALQVAVAGIGETVFGLQARVGSPATLDLTVGLSTAPTSEASPPLTRAFQLDVPAGYTVIADGVAFTLLADYSEVVTLDREEIGASDHNYQGLAMIEGLTAAVDGYIGNVPAGIRPTSITAHPLIASVQVLASPATGGVDEESLLDYLDRLTTYLQTLRPGGVRADDLAAFARTIGGVERAIGLDLYDPADPTHDHERTATIIAITASGEPVTGATKTALQTQLDAAREVNFQVILANPTYTRLQIAVGVTPASDADPTTVRAAVSAAVEALIDPAAWGSTADDARAWVERTKLTSLDVAAIVGRVPGVGALNTVTVNGGASATLATPGALPTPLDSLSAPSSVTVTTP